MKNKTKSKSKTKTNKRNIQKLRKILMHLENGMNDYCTHIKDLELTLKLDALKKSFLEAILYEHHIFRNAQ